MKAFAKVRLRCGAIILFSLTLIIPNATAETRRQTNSGGLEVKLRLHRRVYKVGEAIPLRVEIMNRARSTILINRQFQQMGVYGCDLGLTVRDKIGAVSPSLRNVASQEVSSAEGDSEAVAFLKWWIALDPGNSYTFVTSIDGDQFTFLAKAGKYRVSASISCTGGYPPSIAQRILQLAQEPSKLPFPIWTGKVETNSVYFDVTDGTNR